MTGLLIHYTDDQQKLFVWMKLNNVNDIIMNNVNDIIIMGIDWKT